MLNYESMMTTTFQNTIRSGQPKEDFALSAESRKRAFEKSPFLQKYRKYRKRPFLPKELLSAERASFCRNWRQILPKLMGISAESEAYFCRKSPFRQKDALSAERGSFCRKAESANFLSADTERLSAESICRN